MRIVVHDYVGYAFPAQLARALARRGHAVLFLHCGSFVAGKGLVEPSEGDPPTLAFDSVRLDRPFAKYDVRRRIAHERETGGELARRVADFRPNAVLSSNAPLIVQRALLQTTHAHGGRFVFWQQDVISAAARRVLGRRSRVVGAAAERAVAVLERRLLRESDAVVVISDDFLPLLQRWGVPEERTSVIENWAPLDELPVLPRDNRWAREQELGDRFVLLYSGTLGFKHDPSLLLDLARWAGGHESLVVVVSEGPGAEWLAREGAGEPGLRLLPYQPYERLPEVLASGDMLVALLEPDAGSFSVPSKVLTYLCAARPLLVSVAGDNLAARVVERSGGGLVVPPKDPDALLDAAAALHVDAPRRAVLGRSARVYAERKFDLERIADRFEQVLAAPQAAEPAEPEQEDRGPGEDDQKRRRA
jgi:colanic acid biosynthesis glycosyl transferase WcaI